MKNYLVLHTRHIFTLQLVLMHSFDLLFTVILIIALLNLTCALRMHETPCLLLQSKVPAAFIKGQFTYSHSVHLFYSTVHKSVSVPNAKVTQGHPRPK